MKLASYLRENHITHSDFARRIGVSQVTVTRYAGGQRMPRRGHMVAIIAETKGAVTADDFLFIPDNRNSTHTPPRGQLSHSRAGGKRGH